MKSFMKKIDLFCYRHPKFGISNLMLYIVIGNVAVLLFSAMDTTGLLIRSLEFSTAGLLRGQVWRLLTFVLVPESGGLLFLLMLYFYYFIGNVLEREWGPGRFTIYYLMGMALTILYGVASYFITGDDLGLTGSYINLSMFFAFATLFPDEIVLFMFIIPIKIKWLALADAAYFAYKIFSGLGHGLGMMAFLPLVGVLNYFVFCGDQLFSVVMPTGKQRRKRRWISNARCVKSSMNRRIRTTPTSAPSAAARIEIIQIWSSATAPNAQGITASARITSIIISTSRNNSERGSSFGETSEEKIELQAFQYKIATGAVRAGVGDTENGRL